MHLDTHLELICVFLKYIYCLIFFKCFLFTSYFFNGATCEFQLFEERPIWGKAALCYRLRHMQRVSIRVKQCLPSIAYHFLTGPWRALWVKFGYDPRKDPSAKKYQVVDFRMRQSKYTV